MKGGVYIKGLLKLNKNDIDLQERWEQIRGRGEEGEEALVLVKQDFLSVFFGIFYC